jgi:5-methylthioadenosine/S-adenosylhomocysteine deaminase
MPAKDIFDIATKNGGKALRLNAGVVEEGRLADVILIDLKRADLTPNHDLISSLVYSANGSCVDTVICDGEILMQGRKVQGEEDILDGAEKTAFDLINRSQ